MNNRQIMTHCLFACLLACPTFADYTYVVDSYQPIPTLYGTESLLVIENGGTGTFGMWNSSFASIENTSTLEDGTGGIWHIDLLHSSTLEMSGGQVNLLSFNNDATATLTGGLIQEIWSYQYTATFGPHITIVYSGDLPTVQDINGYDVLVGLWGSGDPFSIYLSQVPHDSYGYSPAIDNIQFQLIPEPATFCLMGAGILLLRKRK